MIEKSYRNALPAGHSLLRYSIERVLGQGAFGITYLARDVNLDRRVAIKEFLPGQYATREGDQSVRTLSADLHVEFHQGLERFLKEARTLAKFEHANLVRVLNVFEANHTAYMVMTYEEGRTLKDVLARTGTLNEGDLRPLLDGLEHIHDASFIHRDIKPANIFIRNDGSPVLIDFGSARQAVRGQSLTLTNFVSQGYAAIEQYSSRSDKQGPWTDIYGMGATLFRAMTGKAPADAVDRSEAISHGNADVLARLSSTVAERYSKSFIQAVEHALAFRAHDRPQSVAEWRPEFDVTPVTLVKSAAGESTTAPVTPPAAEPRTVLMSTAGEVKTVLQPRPDQGGEAGGAQVPPSEAETVARPPSAANTPVPPALARRTRRLQPHMTYRVALLIAIVIALAVPAYKFFAPGGPEENVPAATTTATTAPPPVLTATPPAAGTRPPVAAVPAHPVPPPVPGGATMPPPAPAQSPDQQRAQKIAALLAAARADINALRLTTPKEDNAFDNYLQVLALDSGNAEAQKGITAIAQKYVELTYRDLDGNNPTRAETYLKKAEEIAPQADFVKDARKTFDARRNPPPPASAAGEKPKEETESLKDKAADFKQRFEDFLKSQPPAQKTRADEMRERLGGSH